jgi:hypothetical protein
MNKSSLIIKTEEGERVGGGVGKAIRGTLGSPKRERPDVDVPITAPDSGVRVI